MNDHFNRGYYDYYHDVPLSDCPYRLHSDEYVQWRTGWWEAVTDDQEENDLIEPNEPLSYGLYEDIEDWGLTDSETVV